MATNATVKTIAGRLGVSHVTVSRALNLRSRHLVAEATRAQIEAMARNLQYRPSGIARSFRDQRTHILGFYSDIGYTAGDHFTMSVVAGLQNACDERNNNLLLLGSWQTRHADAIYDSLLGSKVDGLILHTRVDDPLAARLAETTLPLVAVMDTPPGIPLVTGADADGMTQILRLLYERGHRRIAFVTPVVPLPSVDRRQVAYVQFCEERGLRADILFGDPADFAMPLRALDGRATSERPTAICCWNDRFATGLIRTLREGGVRVPGDVSVTGFDGFSEWHGSQELTTACVPWKQITDRACELLLQRIAGEAVPDTTILPVTLHVGATI
jgi:DNA-binding LacI/PurR family transcriptional regulator